MTDVPRETQRRLQSFVDMLVAENARQNLIASSTVSGIWDRHIRDSLQLLDYAVEGPWLDIGTGAGFPGIVIAISDLNRPVVMVEPRARRVGFLQEVTKALELENAQVVQARAEMLPPQNAAVISARAVASLDGLLAMGWRHTAAGCRWLLPKGRRAAEELAVARRAWQGDFTLIPSITDPEASIVMAENVAPRGKTR